MQYGYILAFAAAILWGLSYAINERLLTNLSPWTLMALGSLVSLVIFGPVALWEGGAKAVTELPSAMKKLLVLDLVVALGASTLIYWSIKYIGASRASLIEISYPLFTALACWIWLKQELSPKILIGGFLILAGSWVITFSR